MRDDFHPGCHYRKRCIHQSHSNQGNERLMSQIENMVMQKTDYSIPPDSWGFNDIQIEQRQP